MKKFNIGFGSTKVYHLFNGIESKVTLCNRFTITNFRHAYIQWENVNWVMYLPLKELQRNPQSNIEAECCNKCLKIANEIK